MLPDWVSNKLALPVPEQVVPAALLPAGVQLRVHRADLLHPQLSGNKAYKLFPHLQLARQQQKQQLLSFGGAYSNHIYALADAGKLFGFSTIGYLRGERVEPLNSTLHYAENAGMQLHFLSRSEYRQKTDAHWLEQLQQQHPKAYIIPEGGGGVAGAKGTQLWGQQLSKWATHVAVACGTGATFAGLSKGLYPHQQLLGFPVLKHNLTSDIKSWQHELPRQAVQWQLIEGYHFGGFAKNKPELQAFMYQFTTETAIPLEHVYTGKLFYGLFDLLEKGFFRSGSRVLVLHTGGLRLT